jgi:hypothetical protein
MSIDAPTYNPSQVLEPLPFPEETPELTIVGREYHDFRAALMVRNGEGQTIAYNHFDNAANRTSDIIRLRDLHQEMDRAVLRAYGWLDLAESVVPEFLDRANEDDQRYQDRLFWPAPFRDEVLTRLLALNAERAAAKLPAA